MKSSYPDSLGQYGIEVENIFQAIIQKGMSPELKF